MSCGLPVITTPVANWDGKIVDGTNGFVVKQLDSASIVDALKRGYDSGKKVGDQARLTVQNHASYRIIAKRLEKIYKSII